MRSALFFLLSVTLHAGALTYPLSLAVRDHFDAIPVTLLPSGAESTGGGAGGKSGGPAPVTRTVSPSRTFPAAREKVEERLESGNPAPQIIAAPELENSDASHAALVSATDTASVDDSDAMPVAASAVFQDAGTGVGGFGSGASGVGRGSGTASGGVAGSGSGFGESGSGGAMTPARYRETPRPVYPERARREGRQGRVLVRVLVDKQGRSKRVEVHQSSGSEALDRAAAEAIKRWRFHPARDGDRTIESWLRVPVEFRLEDAN